jgi:hypothetical protein
MSEGHYRDLVSILYDLARFTHDLRTVRCG